MDCFDAIKRVYIGVSTKWIGNERYTRVEDELCEEGYIIACPICAHVI